MNADLRLKNAQKVFVVGQLCGVEGYVESIATGLLAAINAYRLSVGKATVVPPKETVLGALCEYITMPNKDFQPMNANFGILPPLCDVKKSERKLAYYERSDRAMRQWSDGERP